MTLFFNHLLSIGMFLTVLNCIFLIRKPVLAIIGKNFFPNQYALDATIPLIADSLASVVERGELFGILANHILMILRCKMVWSLYWDSDSTDVIPPTVKLRCHVLGTLNQISSISWPAMGHLATNIQDIDPDFRNALGIPEISAKAVLVPLC